MTKLSMNESEHIPSFKAAALFAGIGGFCLGLNHCGVETSWAVENDVASVKTYARNITTRFVENDDKVPKSITEVSVVGDVLHPVDLLHAGFPCQSFSIAGDRKGFEDPRGRLFYEIIRLAKEFDENRPSVLLLENSPNLRTGDSGRWFLEVMSEIQGAGYWFRESNAFELDSYHHTEVPQRRKRLFMVAFATNRFRNGRIDLRLPSAVEKTPVDKLIDFDGALEDNTYYLDPANKYYNMLIGKVKKSRSVVQLRKYEVREKAVNVIPTLTANMGQGGHNVPFIHDSKGLRKLTEYECLRLQGFPQEFVFPSDVPRAKRYQQIGNSVVPPLIELLGHAITRKIYEERV